MTIIPIYDPDPFIRVEKHGLIHIIFYRFENTGRRPKQDDCMERRQRNSRRAYIAQPSLRNGRRQKHPRELRTRSMHDPDPHPL